MSVLIKKVRIIDSANDIDMIDDVFISPEKLEICPRSLPSYTRVIDGTGNILCPGLIDLHVHFREPGFVHKEDINSGIRAALAGGVTSALVMPNTNPALDNFSRVCYQLKQAKKTGFDLMVAGAATKNLNGAESTDVADLKRAGVKALTDDGRPVADDQLMSDTLKKCRRHNLIFMQHAEDLGISCGHSLNEGSASKKLGLSGQPAHAESAMVSRDIGLAEKIGARYHVLHLSSQETLRLVQRAKHRGSKVTCEVAPHHLMLEERSVLSLDPFKKMNPPLRTKEDNQVLIDGINNGTVDAVASDHAPHTHKEKKQAFEVAPFGVVGVETSILVLMTLVKQGKIYLKRAIELMTSGPAKVLLEQDRIGTFLGPLTLKNAVLIDPNYRFIMSERNLFGRSKNSAFLGQEMYGRVLATFLNGRLVYAMGRHI